MATWKDGFKSVLEKGVRDLEVRGRRKIHAESEIHLDLVLKQDLKDKNLDVNKESRKEAKE